MRSTPPLSGFWRRLYARAAARAARELTRGAPAVSVYLRGGASKRAVRPGTSDLDLVAVIDQRLPGAVTREDVFARWASVRRRSPVIALLADLVIYPHTELAAQATSSVLTYGREREPAPSLFFRRPRIPVDIAVRPGVVAATEGWSLLQGVAAIPSAPARTRAQTLNAIWLDLLYWWRHATRLCERPSEPRAPSLSMKLVLEPARAWLWAQHGIHAKDWRSILDAASDAFPEDEPLWSEAREALAHPDRGGVLSPSAALAWLTRITSVVADATSALAQDVTRVDLVGAVRKPLPLLDWRALCLPRTHDDSFQLSGGSPRAPSAIADAARSVTPRHMPTLIEGDLLVRPSSGWRDALMRTIACPVTDPVSFALLRGSSIAMFPHIEGWSIGDVAARAAAEHRGRLQLQEPGVDDLLCAARAAMLLVTSRRGSPAIPTDRGAALSWLGAETGVSWDGSDSYERMREVHDQVERLLGP